MAQTIRVSLPTYNALTDTNIDHYALYADTDNILIKEYTRGSALIQQNSSQPYSISHNLGYIPFFLVFVYDDNYTGQHWTIVPNMQVAYTVPDYFANSDNNNLEIWNFTSSAKTFKWYIFYDAMSGGNISITESNYVIKISKSGVNAITDKNPNNFIFHSDLNTFKIIKEGNASVTYTSDNEYYINHNLTNYSPTAFSLFCKFPDGYVAFLNGTFNGFSWSRDGIWSIQNVYITSTQIRFYIRGNNTNANFYFKYYIYETPL